VLLFFMMRLLGRLLANAAPLGDFSSRLHGLIVHMRAI
jgi:hypothetical protein